MVAWERQTAVMSLLAVGATLDAPSPRRRRTLESSATLLEAVSQRPDGDTDEALVERAMAVGVYWAHAQIMVALAYAERCALRVDPAMALALAFVESPTAATAEAFATEATRLASDWTNDIVVYLHAAGGAATNLAAALDASRSILLRVSSLRDVLAGVDDLLLACDQATRDHAAQQVVGDLARAIRGAA